MPLPNDFLGLQFTSCHYCKFQKKKCTDAIVIHLRSSLLA